MNCHKCGFDNLDDAKSCINCGHRLDDKVYCHKCNKYVDIVEGKCPDCHKSLVPNSLYKQPLPNNKKSKVELVLNKVSTFSFLIILCL